ncbi:MAG TPA: S8 family serine peptidase [Candidatus Limnocylindria bacterium]|nr:S8 family serine peptidase [Candidatus Limnocylindria bacterium]
MRSRRVGAIAIAAALLISALIPTATTVAASLPTGLSQIVAVSSASTVTRGIAEFSAIPTTSQITALKNLGLTVQPMHKVRLALVKGPVSAMKLAVNRGIARDVYPDDPIELLDTASSDAMGGGAAVRAAGFTGKGVTVGIVDSGCDATHPDLADHVVHNVTLASAEYVNGRDNADNTIIVPIDQGPYNNTDIGGGHGTHVAGIVAADSSSVTDGSRYGVAPDANLACFAIGLVLFTSAVVTAYDVMMRQPDLWGIKVVNNSWGNSFRQFDPNDPVSVVTKAISDLGVTVVFASGNSGLDEMSLNPFSEAPWVISVGASKLDHTIASFSSTGLIYDNSEAGPIGAGGHTVYTGDRIGVYHPDVVAPGNAISSTCDTSGTAVGPCPPGENTEASGTSMASPHIAGAAAVLLQANPKLSPTQVRQALQATATPILDANGTPLAFWQVGYGHVNLQAAVNLVRSSNWKTKLASANTTANNRVLASDGFKVSRSEFWTYAPPRATVAGTTDAHTYTVSVSSSTRYLKASLSHPSTTVVYGNNMFYDLTIKDAAGTVIATGEELGSAGTTSAFVDLSKVAGIKYGTFTIEISGFLAVSDPDTLDSDSLLGRMNTLQIAWVNPGR